MITNKESYKGFKITVWQDVDGGNDPRDWDNTGTMVCWHRGYDLGDGNVAKVLGRDDFRNLAVMERYVTMILKGRAVQWLGLIDHSGISMYLGGGPHWSDAAGWDSGTVGLIFVKPENAEGDMTDEALREIIEAEVETYDAFLRGAVYGYTVESAGGETIASCGGFVGDSLDYILGEAKAEIDHHIDNGGTNFARLLLPGGVTP